jgi:hypothetical protein
MKSYRIPGRRDLWRLVEYHGSIESVAHALLVPVDELEDWLGGMRPIPYEQHAAIRALIEKTIDRK